MKDLFEKKIEKKGTIEKRKYDWRNVALILNNIELGSVWKEDE